MKIEVSQSCHNMPCIEARGLPLEIMHVIRAAVACNYMSDERYKLRVAAGAFLQGYEESDGWVLVEFWQPDHQPFVDLINRLINDEKHVSIFRQLIEAE